MKTGKLFKQVFIESEADLPKEAGEYFCNRNGFMSVQHLIPTLNKTYMREIRWYLLPLSEPEVKGAEEMPESFKDLFRCLEDSCYEFTFYGNDGNDNQEKIDGKDIMIQWIKEAYIEAINASQSLPVVEAKTEDELDLIQYVTNLLYAAHGKDKNEFDSQYFDKWVSEKTGELSEYYKAQSAQPVSDDCNHVINAAGESDYCVKCGRKVSVTIKK